MDNCKKCGSDKINTTFFHVDKKIFWDWHKQVENIEKFTVNDRYYSSDRIKKECLVYSCKTCGYKLATETKTN